MLDAGGRNFSIPIPGAKGATDTASGVDTSNELVRQIADAESSDQWTLMHRFNRAADLLDQALTVRPAVLPISRISCSLVNNEWL